MPKMKSHSGAKKRFRFTASGKLKFRRTNAQHLLTGKPSKRMRSLRRKAYASKSDTKILTRMLTQ